MTFHVLTLFPEAFKGYRESSILYKAIERDLVDVRLINIRDFAFDRHATCDDAPYGGGAGMVLKPEPIALALESIQSHDSLRVVYVTPSGRLLKQSMVRELSMEENLIIICGRYEGIDQRIIDAYVTDEISIGDYVLSGGEVAAMVIIDTVTRLIPGVVNSESLEEESFSGHGVNLFEYPHYTRPEVFRSMRVPEVLMSGHHAKIREWREEKRLEKTSKFRPELLDEEHQEDR